MSIEHGTIRRKALPVSTSVSSEFLSGVEGDARKANADRSPRLKAIQSPPLQPYDDHIAQTSTIHDIDDNKTETVHTRSLKALDQNVTSRVSGVSVVQSSRAESLFNGSAEIELIEFESRVAESSDTLPPAGCDPNSSSMNADAAILSRNICVVGLIFSWCIAIACFAFGIRTTPSWRYMSWREKYTAWLDHIETRDATRFWVMPDLFELRWCWWAVVNLIPLALNLLVTICTDVLGFIQTASLRWSLHQEGRLNFNSNLRLLTATKRRGPHRWYINTLSAMFTSICYAATPLLSAWASRKLEPGMADPDNAVYWIPQGIVFVYLGLAIIGQATLASWCLLLNHKTIPTWSSNPINTALICLKLGNKRLEGRCMMSVHDRDRSVVAQRPRKVQASAVTASPFAARIVRWLWLLTAIVLFWGITMALGVEFGFISAPTDFDPSPKLRHSSWNSNPDQTALTLWRDHGYMFALDPPNFPSFGLNAKNTAHVCLLMLVQAPLVFGLHCLEILVNMSRDEAVWRSATTKHGAKHENNAIMAAIKSPQTVMLFAGKAAAHWALASSFDIHAAYNISIRTGPIFALTTILAGLSYFASRLAHDTPAGPQPAAYGHIQTLIDLIDEWSETIYWGDKGVIPGSEVRHAGTLHRRLNPPRLQAVYGGNCCDAQRDGYNEL